MELKKLLNNLLVKRIKGLYYRISEGTLRSNKIFSTASLKMDETVH